MKGYWSSRDSFWILPPLFLLLFFTSTVTSSSDCKTNTCLKQNLLSNYDKNFSPETADDNFFLNLTKLDVISLNVDISAHELQSTVEIDMNWKDDRLTWNYSYPCDSLNFPVDVIWIPSLIISNAKNVNSIQSLPSVKISRDGHASFIQKLQIVTPCLFDLYYYPYTNNNCSIMLPSTDLQDTFRIHLGNISWRDHSTGEWVIKNIRKDKQRMRGTEFTTIQVELFHDAVMINYCLYIPSFLLSLIDIIACLLPITEGGRNEMKVTVMLGYSVFLLMLTSVIPGALLNIPLLVLQYFATWLLLAFSLTESILVTWLSTSPLPYSVYQLMRQRYYSNKSVSSLKLELADQDDLQTNKNGGNTGGIGNPVPGFHFSNSDHGHFLEDLRDLVMILRIEEADKKRKKELKHFADMVDRVFSLIYTITSISFSVVMLYKITMPPMKK